jgi:hypothetical protein
MKSFKNVVAGLLCLIVALLSWSYFAGDKNLTAVDFHILENTSDDLFIFVNGCRINVSVACFQGPPHPFVAIVRPQLIGSVSYIRNLKSRLEFLLWIANTNHANI